MVLAYHPKRLRPHQRPRADVVSGIDDHQRVLTEKRLGERVEVAVSQDGRREIVTLIPTESGFFGRP